MPYVFAPEFSKSKGPQGCGLADMIAGGGPRLPGSRLDLGLDEGMFEDAAPDLRVYGADARSLTM
jgi:hypothetical protein